MNINRKINKTTAIIISTVLIILFTLAFLIFKTTAILITAYIFAIISSVLFCLGNLYFINTKAGYPWIAAIPMTLWRYIIISTLLSAVFVIAEKVIITFSLPALLLAIGQILIFAYFLIMLLLMHTGKEYIEEVDEKVAVKRQFIKELGAELAFIKDNAPDEVKKDIQGVIDSVRYSDPMSNDSVSTLEDDIKNNVIILGQEKDQERILELCLILTKQIKDRNTRVRINK